MSEPDGKEGQETWSELRAKLEAELLEGDWAALAPHHKRGALFEVCGALPLIEAAMAIARDDARAVGAWMEHALLRKVGDAQADAWASDDAQRFQCVIVQPYVVCAPISDAQ